MMKLPLDESPSARSMTLCDHRSTSDHSEIVTLGRITEGESFDRIARHSQQHNVKVRDLAEHIVRLGELPNT